MSTAAEQAALRVEAEAALELVERVVSMVQAGDYSSARAYESDANAARTALAAVAAQVSAVWGGLGWDLLSALHRAGATLLALRALVDDDGDTIEEVADRPVSLIELAVTWYSDATRWTELADLNPHLPHPGDIRPGTTLVRRVR